MPLSYHLENTIDYFCLGELYGSLHYIANKNSGTNLKFIDHFCSFLLDPLSGRTNRFGNHLSLSDGVCSCLMVC